MNNHIRKIWGDIKDIFIQAKEWFLELTRWKQVIVVLIAVLVILMIVRAVTGTKKEDVAATLPRAVTLASVASLSQTGGTLPLLGTVTSRNEATIRADSYPFVCASTILPLPWI